MLKKCDRLVNKVKSRCRKNIFKFGIDVTLTFEDALKIDQENGNTLWNHSIGKDMKNSRVYFNLLDRDDHAPVGYKETTCHLIFDVKMDLTRKDRYVAGGHLVDPPSSMTYASVVSRDSVRLAFLIAELNDLDIIAGYIQNAYSNALTKEKLFFYAGNEWKYDQGKPVIIVRALYGLKYSDLAGINHLSEILGNRLGFQSSLDDPDVWFEVEKDKTGNEYYNSILFYADDFLIVDKYPRKYMAMLESNYPVKPSSIGEPKVYIGADVGKLLYVDGSYA